MARYKFSDIAFNITDKIMPVPADKDTYIGLEHMDSGSLEIRRWGSKVILKGEKLRAKKGDVLFGRRNAYLKRAAIAPFDCAFSAHGMILRPNTDIVTDEFFPLFIISDYFMDKAIEISVGSLSPTVNWGTLKDVEFDIPCIEEQKKASILLWEIEYEKQAVANAIDKLKQIKDSFLFEKIVPDDNWQVSCVEDTFDLLPSNSLSRNKLNNEAGPAIDIHYGDIHVVFNEIVDVKNDFMTYLNEDSYLKKIKSDAYCINGDIIIADASEDTAGLGKAVELTNITDEKVLAGLHTFHCRPKEQIFAEGYLGYIMNSEYVHGQIENLAVGTKIYSITKKDLLQVNIPIPDYDLQLSLVKSLREIDEGIKTLKLQEENTDRVFKCILQEKIH